MNTMIQAEVSIETISFNRRTCNGYVSGVALICALGGPSPHKRVVKATTAQFILVFCFQFAIYIS